MTTPAGWFDDPTHPGRLRYWDGSSWTEWVSENGETRSEPLPGGPAASPATVVEERPADLTTPAPGPVSADVPRGVADGAPAVVPTPGIVPAPAWGDGATPPPAAGDTRRRYPLSVVGRLGFGLIAGAGVVAALATGRAVSRDPLGLSGYDMGNLPIGVGLVLIVAAALGLAVPRPFWVRLVALVLASGAMSTILFLLIGARTGDQFAPGTDVQLKAGGQLFLAAGVLSIAGIALAAVAPSRRASGAEAGGGPATTAKPVLSLVLSLLGIVTLVTAAPGVAAGMTGRDDIRASGGRLSGSGLALAGIIIGGIVFALAALGLLAAALTTTP